MVISPKSLSATGVTHFHHSYVVRILKLPSFACCKMKMCKQPSLAYSEVKITENSDKMTQKPLGFTSCKNNPIAV